MLEWVSDEVGGLTLRMRMQRRSPKTMTTRPPLNMIERAHFLLAARRDFQIISRSVSGQ